MSHISSKPVIIPDGVAFMQIGDVLTIKGKLGELKLRTNSNVLVSEVDKSLTCTAINETKFSKALAGTFRSLLHNMVCGVTTGFQKKLDLVGVGYKAQLKGDDIHLSLGFSHPVVYKLPDGVKAATPSPTEVILTSIDKQVVGQVAANIRAFRPPEPYKGKGIKYSNEVIRRKETKKK